MLLRGQGTGVIHPGQAQDDAVRIDCQAFFLCRLLFPAVNGGRGDGLLFSVGALDPISEINLVGAAEQAFCGKFRRGRGHISAAAYVDPPGAFGILFAHAKVGNGGAVEDAVGPETAECRVYSFWISDVQLRAGGSADLVCVVVKCRGPSAEKAGRACDQ